MGAGGTEGVLVENLYILDRGYILVSLYKAP